MIDEARRLRNEGVARAEEHQDALWRALAKRQAMILAKSGQPFSIDDVTDVVGRRGNAAGSITLSLARRGLIVKTGQETTSRHKETHAHPNPVWVGTAAARDLVVEPVPPGAELHLQPAEDVMGVPLDEFPEDPPDQPTRANLTRWVVDDHVPACSKCRKPFAETRPSAKWRKAHGLRADDPEGSDEVREGRCETHGWQQYAT